MSPRITTHRRATLLLHLLTALTSVASITLFSLAIPLWNANFLHTTGPSAHDWTDGLPLAPLSLTFLLAISLLLCQATHSLHIPSRITITLTTLNLLLLAPALILATTSSLSRHWRPPTLKSSTGIVNCQTMLNVFSQECMPILYTIGRLQIAGIVFGAVTWCGVFGMLLAAIHEARVAKQEARSGKGGTRLLKTLTLSEGDVESGTRRKQRQGLWSTNGGECERALRTGGRRSHGSRREARRARRVSVDREWKAGDQVPFPYVNKPEVSYQKSQYGKVTLHQMTAFG